MKSFLSVRAVTLICTFFSVITNATISCPSSNNTIYTATDGATYNIECFYDRPNGDISNYNSTSMENCITSCESTTSCIDVAFYPPASGAVNGTCYRKSTLNTGQSNSNVWGGRKVSAATTSTTSTTSSKTSSSTMHTTTSTTTSTISSVPVSSTSVTSTFTQSAAKVTNAAASGSGSGPSATSGPAAADVYNCFDGNLSSFPAPSKWATYANLWANNSAIMTSTCGYNNWGPNNTPAQVQLIGNAIQQVASDSNVDPRFILAVIMQESEGCLNVPTTTSPPPDNIPNPGIMQDYNGTHTWIGNTTANASTAQQSTSIVAMIRDGVQGTGASGPSLVKGLNRFANIYEAARNYNSGCVNEKNMNDGISSTETYVVDIANRMTGWVLANRNYNCLSYANGGAGDCTASA